jgi:hypothetical protein
MQHMLLSAQLTLTKRVWKKKEMVTISMNEKENGTGKAVCREKENWWWFY